MFAERVVEALSKYGPMLHAALAAARGDEGAGSALRGVGKRQGLGLLLVCRSMLNGVPESSRDPAHRVARAGIQLGASYALLLTVRTADDYARLPVMSLEDVGVLIGQDEQAWLEQHSGYDLQFVVQR